jgi:hypothetical protein
MILYETQQKVKREWTRTSNNIITPFFCVFIHSNNHCFLILIQIRMGKYSNFHSQMVCETTEKAHEDKNEAKIIQNYRNI